MKAEIVLPVIMCQMVSCQLYLVLQVVGFQYEDETYCQSCGTIARIKLVKSELELDTNFRRVEFEEKSERHQIFREPADKE